MNTENKIVEAVETTAEVKEETQTEICSVCNEAIVLKLEEHLQELDGEKLCDTCFNDETFICEDCNEREWTDNQHNVEGDERSVCDNCDESYYTCDCGYRYHEDNGYGCGDCDYNSCSACGEDHYHEDENEEADGYYRNYSKTPIVGDVKKAKYLKYDRLVGIEVETIGGDPEVVSELLDKRVGIEGDGSLSGSYAIELQTPPASANELEKIIANVSKTLRKSEYKVNSTCGLHIHLDSKDIKDKQSALIKLFNTYYSVEPIIWAMLPKSRKTNTFCKPMTHNIKPEDFSKIAISTRTKDEYYIQKKWYKTTSIKQIENWKGQKCGGDRYYGFNGHALYGLGHLELRYHSGTINKKKIRNWVELNLLLFEWAIKNYKKITIDVLNSIENDDVSLEKKVNLFYRLFNVPQHLRSYISERITKFRNTKESEDTDEDDSGEYDND